MSNKKYKEIIEDVLKSDDRLWNKEKTEFNIPLLFNFIDQMDEKIISLLLDREEIRKKFFLKVKDAYVFKTNEFKFFIEEHKVFNSYTSYPNRIGLSDGKEFIIDRGDVVINFPFKDCILEGGQTTEEGIDTYFEYDEKVTKTQKKQGWKAGSYNEKQDKRKEIFFNEILAQDEIDRLLDKKAFVNWKRYTKSGVEKVGKLKRDENGLIRENLVIKGNNLLALRSLESQFTGKIKLIYIDPPYYFPESKSGSDEFAYNTNFKLSTWLTFMKNRLEVAKKLLTDDGAIFVHIGGVGASYLNVLMDEIFGRDNFLTSITCKVKAPSGVAAGAQMFFDCAEYIKVYAKDRKKVQYKDYKVRAEVVDKNSKTSESYNMVLEYINLEDKELIGTVNEIKIYKINPKDYTVSRLTPQERTSDKYYELHDKIFRTATLSGGREKQVKQFIDKINEETEMFMYEYIPTKGKNKGQIVNNLVYKKEGVLMLKDYTDVDYKNKKVWKLEHITNILHDDWWQGISNEGGVTLKNGKKPEILLKTIIDIMTDENDIVLDFFLGTGTTAAVAHKMNRQYVGIEQLDYGENNAVTRLNNVVNGDTTGISKHEDVNWQGGGDFIYFELAKWNEKAKEEIMECNNLEELKKLFTSLCDKYYLNYNIRVNDFKNKTIEEEEFKKLPLEEQKKMFLTMLDLNQLYVQKTEMEDKKFGISEEDQRLTKMFYGEE